MLHSNMNYLKQFVYCLLLTTLMCNSVFAAGSSNSTSVKPGWNTGGTANGNAVSNSLYILAGCTSSDWNSNCRGTYSDEGAIVVNMARKFNDNGGYFCPTQVQFGNQNFKTRIWVNLHSVLSGASCRWICKPGFKGENCATVDNGDVCGTGLMTSLKSATARTSGGMDKKITDMVEIFSKSEHTSNDSDRNASITVLGILNYYQHGVLVGRMTITGKRDWKGEHEKGELYSWVNGVSAPTERFLLCDTGFKPKADYSDCEPIDRTKCGLAPEPLCSGWTQADYKKNETDLEYHQVGGCWQYRCSDRNKAFPSAENRTCEPCSTGVRGGADANGVCKRCDLAQYFDETDGICKTALGLSKSDLQYGKGKSNTGNVKDQCWTKTDPDAYKCCVINDRAACGRATANATNVQSGYTSVSYVDTKGVAMAAQRLSATDAMSKQPGF